jgi:hypothetical protein
MHYTGFMLGLSALHQQRSVTMLFGLDSSAHPASRNYAQLYTYSLPHANNTNMNTGLFL